MKALVEEFGLDSRRKLNQTIELCRGFYKARITCEINQEMILKAKVSKMNREEAMIAALRILLNKLRNRCFPT